MRIKRILMPAMALLILLLATNALASISIGASSPQQNGVLCQRFGNTIDLNISDLANVGGAADGNLFAFYVTQQSDGNLGIADNGAGNIHPDFNAFYASSIGDMNVRLTVPTTALAASVTTGDLTLTVKDLNGGKMVATITLNVKPVWTQTEFTASPLICNISNYTAVSNFKLTDSSSNSIKFRQNVDISGNLDFDAGINLANDSAEVKTETLTTLANREATLVFPNLQTANLPTTAPSQLSVWFTPSTGNAEQPCPSAKCTTLDVANGTATLKVTGFSKYRLDKANGNQQVFGALPLALDGTINVGGAQVSTAMILLVVVVALVIGAYMLFVNK